MNRDEFRQHMNNYKKARESNPSLSYWQWKANKYADGTDGIEDDRQFVLNWFNARKNYKNNLVQRQLREIENNHSLINRNNIQSSDYALQRYRENQAVNTANVTIQSGIINNNPNIGGYYHPNEGIILQKKELYDNNRASGVHEFSHIINTKTKSIKNIINNIQYNQQIYDRGSELNQYLTNPSEVHSRLMEFRKLNNLNPTEWITMPQLQNIKKNGKDVMLFDLYKDDNVILDLLNNVASITSNKNIIRVKNGTDGIVDELKANSRTTLTPEEQRYLLNKSRQRQRMSGAITPVFDIQDAVDFTPIGDVLTARDAYNAVQDRDYIKASAMLGLMLAPPALGRIAKEKIPSFVTAAADKINELRRRERKNKELDTKIFSQGIEDRNRIIEELYDTPGIWDRAYNTDITYGTNYVDTYDNLINNYYSNYFNLPEPIRKDIGDAQAMMSAKPEAIRRYNDEGIPASWSDFAYYINPSIENLDKALTRHEMGHYVDFIMSKSNNADRGNLMFDELRKDLSVDPNPLIPNKTDYFRQGTEQKSYMNTLRQFMFDNNMINRIDDQVTQKQIKEAINKLPSELKSVKAAYQQFKSPRKYTKWFNTIPLLGLIPFIYNYSQEKDSN